MGITIAAGAFGAARLIWRTPEQPVWSGVMLGGSEIALDPRLSPDGHLLSFEAVVDGLSQIAVLKPESGNWSILTHDRGHGPINSHSWSPDGSLIYYDRYTDVPQGIYSVPVLGGDERLVVENAFSPEALPDGSLLIVRQNDERKFQLSRFWPGTGQMQGLPIRPTGDIQSARFRGLPDGKTAVAWGEPIGQTVSSPGFYVIELSSGSIRRVDPHGVTNIDGGRNFTPSFDGKSIVTFARSGALIRIFRLPMSGAVDPEPLLTVTSNPRYLDAGPGDSIYANVVDRPVDVVRFALDGTQVERLASFPQIPDLTTMTILPDGRAVLPVRESSQVRLMAVQKGKDPAPLVNTTEETAAPVSVCGPREVAFMIGPEPHETIGFAEPASGRLARSNRSRQRCGGFHLLLIGWQDRVLRRRRRDLEHSILLGASGAEARKVRAGDSIAMDPSGQRLIVQSEDGLQLHRFSVPLDGGPEQEIPIDASIASAPIQMSPNAMDAQAALPGFLRRT